MSDQIMKMSDGREIKLIKVSKIRKFFNDFKLYKTHNALAVMFLPVILWFIIFKYVPMYGLTMAFKDYKISLGIMGSPWNGIENFAKMFSTSTFVRAIRNTVIISSLKLVLGFPMPLIFALFLNEIRHLRYKKIIQTISYLPHFLSWVVIAGLFYQMLSPTSGIVNYIIKDLLGGKAIYFMGSNDWFRTVLVVSAIWQGVGWSSILYLAALAGISPHLYEAAVCDGANRWQMMWYITLPSLLPTISILFILRVGYLLSAGFDQIFNMYNTAVYETSDIIDTYVYRYGLGKMKYAAGTAIGLFKNIIGFALVIITNAISKKISDNGIW
ncbi:MAG: sugar ABC transporter permease [Clostridiales bacterium]|nr:sugar ABC transporter permease [Clostridiales bacterium]